MPFPRCRRPEIMDQPGLGPARHLRALRGLARINFFSGAARILWPPLAALSRELAPAPLRVLDVASGGGDVLLRLWRKARRAGLSWRLEGCDLSPVAVEHASSRAQSAGTEVRFFVQDVLNGPPLPDADAIICSLFLHHLDEADAVRLLRNLAGVDSESGPRLVLVLDLTRSRTGLLLAHIATRLLTLSDVVHTDGPRSVEAAFTPAESRALAEAAGLHGARIERRWPCRWLLTWRRS
jgi:SAM-dependent methyltransferase